MTVRANPRVQALTVARAPAAAGTSQNPVARILPAVRCQLPVVLMLMTGCPSEFGKEGRIAKAVRKDTLELVREYDCDDETRKQYCDGGRHNTSECIEMCG